MKADTICCYCISKRIARGIAESLHAYITRARLTVYEVGVFSITTLKLCPPCSLWSYLSSSSIGVFSRLQYNLCDTDNDL